MTPLFALSDAAVTQVCLAVVAGFGVVNVALNLRNKVHMKQLEIEQQKLGIQQQAAAATAIEVKDNLKVATAKQEDHVEQVTAQVAEVKQGLDQNTVVTKEIHALTDGGLSIQMRLVKMLARQVAEMTTDPAKARAAADVADEAERAFEEHEASQRRGDDRTKADAGLAAGR